MFSQKTAKMIDACRFCWMCRHLCPIGLQTGKESNTPRAKALMMSLTERGLDLSHEMMTDMYECALCNACANDCATGYEPPFFIREARSYAVVNGLVPEKVSKVIDSALENGNIYGEPSGTKFDQLVEELKMLPNQAEVLLYIGDTAARRAPQIAKAVISLLKKAKVDFTVLRNEPPCATELYDLIGFVGEVQQTSEVCAKAVNKTNAKTLVVLDPACARVFRQEYPAWGFAISAEVVTATTFIADLIKNDSIKVQKTEGDVTFHDPCRLSRDMDESAPAREIINAMGYTLHEMFLCTAQTKCCGGEIVNAHSPNLTQLTSRGRMNDAQKTGAKTLLCACPACFDIFKKSEEAGLTVEDLFISLDRCVTALK